MTFSERYGFKSVTKLVQVDSMDDALRIALWNNLTLYIWNHVRASTDVYTTYRLSAGANSQIASLCHELWMSYFKLPLDRIADDWLELQKFLRNYFFECEWCEAYDFVEFVANNYEGVGFKENFIRDCNAIFERELSGYRFVDSQLCPITDHQELQEIEQALVGSQEPVQLHLHRALELLSDRSNPDYRNSIKESISALESYVLLSLGVTKGTLGQLIKNDELGLHPALQAGISNIYGYTSDESGVRHALIEADDIRFEDAKFLLILCTAFINFMQGKKVRR